MLCGMTWHQLEPVDATFFDDALFAYRYPVELAVPPERVWESLTSDRALADWGLPLRRLEWTSPRPFGVGTSREVDLAAGLVTIKERFFRWEEGERYSFYAESVNRNVLHAFAEDYVVERTSGGSRFTWTIAMTPTARARPLFTVCGPLNAQLCKAVPIRAKAYFARHP